MSQKTRDLFPDQLRGFALLGIALVNIAYLSLSTFSGAHGEFIASGLNATVAFLVITFAQAKFYLLFSFLFGYSAHYVIKDSKANRFRFRARAFGLIVFGFIHALLFFHGDILVGYGILGLILLAFYFRKESTLKVWSWLIFIGSALLFSAASLLLWFVEFIEQQPAVEVVGFDQALVEGSFIDAATARLASWPEFFLAGIFLQGPFVLMAFLIGVMAARKNLLASDGISVSQAKKLVVLGFGLGLPFQLLSAWIFVTNEQAATYSEAAYLGSVTINFVTAPLLSAGYIGALWLIARAKPKAMKLFESAGRMSLTVYLSQSIIFSFIFSGYGLGLFAQVSYWLTVVIAIAVYFLLAIASVFYFQRFKMGPFEKLLNLWTKSFSKAANG